MGKDVILSKQRNAYRRNLEGKQDMKNPFVYGEEVTGDAFWNRTKEIQELARDIHNGQNVIIFSARPRTSRSRTPTAVEDI